MCTGLAEAIVFKLRVDEVGREMYGYRFTEIDPYILEFDVQHVKNTVKIKKCSVTVATQKDRVPISRTLPVYFEGAALPRPCPNSAEGKVISLLKRSGTKPPPRVAGVLEHLKTFTRSFCESHFERLTGDEAEFDDWVEGINHPQARKDELRKVHSEFGYDDPREVFQGTWVNSFVKDEPSMKWAAPRAINARDDVFKVYSGPLFDAISQKVFCHSWFIKKIPVVDRPSVLLDALFRSVGKLENTDASSYESHFEREVMESIEFVLYDYMVESVPAYQQRMDVIKEVLMGPQEIHYKEIIAEMTATRMSGEMNTSLGNGFTTVVLNMFVAWLKETEVDLFAEGDDNIGMWADRFKAPTTMEWRNLGWIMKVEEPDVVSEASFCGNVFAVENQVVVTDPREALLNFGWTKKNYTRAKRSVLLQLLKSKGLSMAHQYNGCPMLSAFGRRIAYLTRNVTIRKSVFNNMNMYERDELRFYWDNVNLPQEKTVDYYSRQLVERLYNIPVQDQMQFELDVNKIELDMVLSFDMLVPTAWQDNYRQYSTPCDTAWAGPGEEDPKRLETFIRSFGKTTAGFCRDFYGG